MTNFRTRLEEIIGNEIYRIMRIDASREYYDNLSKPLADQILELIDKELIQEDENSPKHPRYEPGIELKNAWRQELREKLK